MQKKKLLIINSDAIFRKQLSFIIHKSTGDFLEKLNKKGIDVTIFHFVLPLDHESVANFKLDLKNIKVAGGKRYSSKLVAYFRASLKLFQLIRKVDYVYLFYPNAFYYCLFFSILNKKPFGLYLRGEKNIESKISKFLFQKSEFVSTISPQFTDLVNISGGNGITIKPMIDFGVEDIIKNRVSFYKEIYTLLFIGRVEREKGVFELVDAVYQLKTLGISNFKLDIIGQGRHYSEIKERIHTLGVENLIILNGVITDKSIIKEFYEEADLFVFPTHHEGFPRVLYEAMIFDTPILTTFVGSIPYLMKDNFNCYRIEEKCVNSIVLLLVDILNNYETTSRVAKNASNTIKGYLTTNNLLHEDIVYNNFFKL